MKTTFCAAGVGRQPMKRSYKRIIGSRLIVTALAVLIQLTWLWGLLEFLAP